MHITLFIVGQDAELEKIAGVGPDSPAGHEVGNHSYHHEPWLHLYSEAEIERELTRAENAIEAVTGVRPTGFVGRASAFRRQCSRFSPSQATSLMRALSPTFLGPLAQAYYFAKSRGLSDEEKRKRNNSSASSRKAFGRWLRIDGKPQRATRDPCHDDAAGKDSHSRQLSALSGRVQHSSRSVCTGQPHCTWLGSHEPRSRCSCIHWTSSAATTSRLSTSSPQ